MKWNNMVFNVNFSESIQNGINEFSKLSGYKTSETRQVVENKILRIKGRRYAVVIYFLMAMLFITLLLKN
jgi:hypothetical protein